MPFAKGGHRPVVLPRPLGPPYIINKVATVYGPPPYFILSGTCYDISKKHAVAALICVFLFGYDVAFG